MVLKKSFYLRDDVCEVARDLIGCKLITRIGGKISSGIIVETEAYSETERACHAYNGKRTARTQTLFMEGGVAYVYLIYGMYDLFNVVTNREGIGEAVLIRAVEPIENLELMKQRRKDPRGRWALTSGPGKLTRALGITRTHNKLDLGGKEIWIETGREVLHITAAKRIGVEYAGEDAELPWRFYETGNSWVSKF